LISLKMSLGILKFILNPKSLYNFKLMCRNSYNIKVFDKYIKSTNFYHQNKINQRWLKTFELTKPRYEGYPKLIYKCLLGDMYIEITRMKISYGEVNYVYEKAYVIIIQVILIFTITKLSYIKNVMLWSLLHVIPTKGNKWADIGYNMNYIKVFEWLIKDLLT